MTKDQLISKYSQLYRQAGTRGEETNDQMAYKNILIMLRNNKELSGARDDVGYILFQSPNQDRMRIYQAFLKETAHEGEDHVTE